MLNLTGFIKLNLDNYANIIVSQDNLIIKTYLKHCLLFLMH